MIAFEARDLSDAVLINRSRDDPEYFALLYDRYAGQIYRYAHRRAGGTNPSSGGRPATGRGHVRVR